MARPYQLLRNKYSQIKNLGGHPYGISAPLQLYTIGTLIGKEVFGLDSMLLTYQMIKEGHWLISSSSYFFFKAEYESILEIKIESKDSKYEKILKFNQFLGDFVIPYIKERSGFSEFNKAGEPKRTYIHSDDTQYLVSFKEILIPNVDTLYFGGILWNLDTVITQIIPPIIDGLTKETGLEFQLINRTNIDILTGIPVRIPEKSLTLSFSIIPFPWSLVAIQPGYKKLESDVKTQLIIYGFLVFPSWEVCILVIHLGILFSSFFLPPFSRDSLDALVKSLFIR